MADTISDPGALSIAHAIATEAVRESEGDLRRALMLVSQVAALFAANVSTGYMRFGAPKRSSNSDEVADAPC